MPRAAPLDRAHWIFDLDGTLTEAVHDFAAIRRRLGIPAGIDILAYLDHQPPARARALHAQLDAIEYAYAEQAAAAPGCHALLAALARRGVRLGIVTRNTRAVAHAVLRRIGVAAYFDAGHVLGRGEAIPKPHPDGVQQLMRRWHAGGDEVLVVGDYLYDLLSGRAAGAATVHVDRSGNWAWPEHADLCVASLDELALRLDR